MPAVGTGPLNAAGNGVVLRIHIAAGGRPVVKNAFVAIVLGRFGGGYVVAVVVVDIITGRFGRILGGLHHLRQVGAVLGEPDLFADLDGLVGFAVTRVGEFAELTENHDRYLVRSGLAVVVGYFQRDLHVPRLLLLVGERVFERNRSDRFHGLVVDLQHGFGDRAVLVAARTLHDDGIGRFERSAVGRFVDRADGGCVFVDERDGNHILGDQTAAVLHFEYNNIGVDRVGGRRYGVLEGKCGHVGNHVVVDLQRYFGDFSRNGFAFAFDRKRSECVQFIAVGRCCNLAHGRFGLILNRHRNFVGCRIAAVVFDGQLDLHDAFFEIAGGNRVFERYFGDIRNSFSVDRQCDFYDAAVAVGGCTFDDEIFIQIENRPVLRSGYRTFGRVRIPPPFVRRATVTDRQRRQHEWQ